MSKSLPKKRLAYQGAERKVKNLGSKISSQKLIIKNKCKAVKRKKNGEVISVNKQLTPAELTNERRVLEKLRLDMVGAKEKLKQTKFSYTKQSRADRDKQFGLRKLSVAKNKTKQLTQMKKLVEVGKLNGKMSDLKEIQKKFKKTKGEYTDVDFKRDVLPIVNSYNKSIPITSLSKAAILN